MASELVERLKGGVLYDDAGEILRVATKALMREAASRIKSLESEVARLSQWEWICDYDEPERQSDNVSSLADDMDLHGVMRVIGYREVCQFWIAHRCLSVDDTGSVDETEVVEFSNDADALKCWPESFEAARNAIAKAEGDV